MPSNPNRDQLVDIQQARRLKEERQSVRIAQIQRMFRMGANKARILKVDGLSHDLVNTVLSDMEANGFVYEHRKRIY